jgi:hypothetical protein
MNSNQEQADAKKISLGEFVKQLVLDLHRDETPMPFQNETNWHVLFYKLKKTQNNQGRPAFLDKLRFDWDGPYPRCQDLSEYLQTLHWNGFVSVANPSYDRLSVDADVFAEAKRNASAVKDKKLASFLRFSAEEASKLFRAPSEKAG